MAGEKRNQDQDEVLLARTVLVDIEGTTTSISFVKETLFSYVRQHLKDYIEAKWEDEEFKKDYEQLKEQAKKDEEDKLDGFVAIAGDKLEEEKNSLLKNVFWQMDNDRKTGALKQLQGHMWREAYKTGAIKAHVYEDVPKALESWTNDGRKIYVYSSGSIEAQELLFEHSIHGNLLKYFSGFFDTKIGAKQESDSYKNILSDIGEKPSNVVFLTDVVKEAVAAKEAGLSTVIVIRDGNAALTGEEKITYTTVKSFLDLTFQTSAKRQKLETTDEKLDECTTNVCEPMDTSEDVDMSDRDIGQSNERVEESEAKETVESEEKERTDSQPSKDASSSLAQKEEPMTIEKDSSKVEQEIPVSETTESDGIKSKETSENPDAKESESVEQIAKKDNSAATPATKASSDKIAAAEKTEENSDAAAIEITPTADDSVNMSVSESKSASKSENAPTSEKKTEDSTDLAKDTQIDNVADNVETIATDCKAKVHDHGPPTCEKSMADKKNPEESLKMEMDEAKEESKMVPGTSESENVSTKSEPEEVVAKLQTNATDLAENGETVEAAGAEKSPVTVTVKSTVADTEANTTDVKEDVTPPSKISTDKSLDANEQAEKTDEKTAEKTEETKVGETTPTDAEERDDETTKQESAKEKATVKEENEVVDTKDKNTVDSEKQKLNGTAQNGDTDVPVLDDKLHSNGLNEGPSKETTGEDAAAQNGEPESSSESSAESIKVKKVVDSAVADGAGEPDVVPPVVVAATS